MLVFFYFVEMDLVKKYCVFRPSQKSPIPLNRYDDFVDDLSYRSRSQEQTPEPRLVARALYNFVGQSSRELTFRRGDLIFVRRQVDKNWYEGEHNAMIGLFPFNYVEVTIHVNKTNESIFSVTGAQKNNFHCPRTFFFTNFEQFFLN